LLAEGAVISFQDIHALKRLVEETRAYADTLIETARESILILDANLNVVVANPSFYSAFDVSPAQTVNRPIFELGNRQWDIPGLRKLLESIIQEKTRVDDFEVRHEFQQIGERIMILNARRLSTKQSLIFLSIEDVTEHRKSDEALKVQTELLKQSEDSLRRLSAYLMTLQDEERRRIARELHDSTGQKLAAAKLQLDTLVKSGNLKSHEKVIAETAQWIDECFQEVRTLSQLLHPPLLDEAGLLSATERASDQVEILFAKSLEMARGQQARCWELRTACDLASFWQSKGRAIEALHLLQPIYAQFTEGFDSADLRHAKQILDSLDPTASQK